MVVNSNSHAAHRLSKYISRSDRERQAERDYAATLIPALADRCYHLPGNNYCQDWFQYFMNNHPVLGICCHDKLHPIGFRQRIVTLVGSIAFGLIITNIFFLSLISTDEAFDDLHDPIVSLSVNSTLTGSQGSDQQVTITYGMILLWTVGTSVHSIFDMTIWYMSACACCHPGGRFEQFGCCKMLGSSVVIFAVVLVVAVASVIVVYRASIESQTNDIDEQDANGNETDGSVEFGKVNGVESFDFLLSWTVEVVIALFAAYPLIGTIFFTGVLGCGRLPFLGGRPREMWLEEQERLEIQRKGTDETDRV